MGFFDEHNHFVPDCSSLTPEQLRRCRWRRYYSGVSLLHTNRALTQFLYLNQRVLWEAESESPPLGALMDEAVAAAGARRIKRLIHDKGFMDGTRTSRFKTDYGIESVFPLKAGMLDWEDAKRLAQTDGRPWQIWRPPAAPTPIIPPQRPQNIRNREAKRQETLLRQRARAVPAVAVDRMELKAIHNLRLWEGCTVPIHVVLLREFRTDGACSEFALATTQDFDDPLKVWNDYRLRVCIEERHRQMKCFWDLTHFRSRAYSLVVNQVIFMVLAYSLMQCFLVKCEREDLTGVTRRRLLEKLLPTGHKVCLYRNNRVGYLTPLELLSEILDLPEGPKRRLIGTVRRLCSSSLAAPDLPLRP